MLKYIKFFLSFIKKIIISIYLYIGHHGKSSFPHYLSIVAILKNEGQYIAEWLEYHLLVGVSKFYIYDNESEDNLKEILEPYIESGIVEYQYFPGIAKQLAAYKDALKKARIETYWLAAVDGDEFIVPVSTQTIPEFLKEFEGCGGIEINWLVYGSSGKKTKEDGLVIEGFKDHSLSEFEKNLYVKTILNPRFTVAMHIHNAKYTIGKYSVNPNKEILKVHYLNRERCVQDKIRINHYYGKSYEEFLLKRSRGRATQKSEKTRIRPIQLFFDYDKNDIKNDPIMDKYIPLIYKNIKQRYNKSNI